MSNETHTPTPWHMGDDKHTSWFSILAMPKERGGAVKIIANMQTHANSEANAAFIVKACNAHQEMVNLLTDIELFMRVNAPMNDGCKIHKNIKSILAKVLP